MLIALGLLLSVPSAPDIGRDIRDYLQPFADDHQLSGSLLVAKGDKILFERSYGMANYELAVPNSRDTAFNVASVTKTVTLIPVLQDIYAKKLDLKAKLKDFIPDFPNGDKISVLDLINHRSGIPHSVTTDAEESEPQTAESMAKLAAKATPMFEPGTKSVYSSAGFSVLARVLEIEEGKSYDDIIRERVFRVAGMDHSTSDVSDYFVRNRASCYIQGLDEVWPAQPKNYSFLVGAGCVNSTPRDLFKLLHAVVDGKFGEMVRKNLGDKPQVYWNGLTSGFRAFVQYDSADKVTVIFCGNTVTGAAERLRDALPKIVRGERIPPPERLHVVQAKLSESQLAKFEGTYEVTGETFRMVVRKGVLIAGDNVLIPIAEDRFFGIRDFGEVRTQWTPDGKVAKLEWYEGKNLIVTMMPVKTMP